MLIGQLLANVAVTNIRNFRYKRLQCMSDWKQQIILCLIQFRQNNIQVSHYEQRPHY